MCKSPTWYRSSSTKNSWTDPVHFLNAALFIAQELHVKNPLLKATFMSALVGLSAGETLAADYKKSPFKLAYDGAINKNEQGKVNIHPVSNTTTGMDIINTL